MNMIGIVLGMMTLVCSADNDWVELIPEENLSAFKKASPKFVWTGKVTLDETKRNKLVAGAGKGAILFNNNEGLPDLITNQFWGDHEIHLEFLIAKGSNSGIKMHKLYEIQIFDSFGKTNLTGSDCGGVYPRWELKPAFTYIDKGIPPSKNACKPAGEWQTLDITFLAPRFDEAGNKVKNARLPKVVLNGELIHDDVELLTPTGNNFKLKEKMKGQIMIQVDHGPVAFKNIKVRELKK